MTTPNDTQSMLLSSASTRGDGSLYLLPGGLKPVGGTAKALATLIALDPAAYYRYRQVEAFGVAACPSRFTTPWFRPIFKYCVRSTV